MGMRQIPKVAGRLHSGRLVRAKKWDERSPEKLSVTER